MSSSMSNLYSYRASFMRADRMTYFLFAITQVVICTNLVKSLLNSMYFICQIANISSKDNALKFQHYSPQNCKPMNIGSKICFFLYCQDFDKSISTIIRYSKDFKNQGFIEKFKKTSKN